MCFCGRPVETDGAWECDRCIAADRAYDEYYTDTDAPRQSNPPTEPIRLQPRKVTRGQRVRNEGE